MEQNKPEYLDDSPEAASVDESRRGYYESEIKKAIDNVKREADYTALEARCAGLERERDALKAELERERVRLAGCGVAAMGYEDKEPLEPGSYGYSASYDDVLRFRKQFIADRDALQAKLAAAEADREILVRERTKEPEMQAVFERAIAAFSRTEHVSRCGGNEWRQRAEAAVEALRQISRAIALNPFLNQAHAEAVLQDIKDIADAILAGHAPATPQTDHKRVWVGRGHLESTGYIDAPATKGEGDE